MAEFQFKAYSPQGALVSGSLEAASEAAAFASLRDRQMIPVEIAAGAAPASAGGGSKARYDRVFLARFTRMMASLLASHVPLVDAVAITLENEKKARPRRMLETVRKAILNGASLSEALEKAPGFSPAYYRSMVVAGEKSGSLGVVLGDLAEQIEHEQTIRSRIRSGLLYPAILFATSLVVLFVISSVLIPAITPLFENSGKELPTAIAMVTGARVFVTENWIAILTGLALCVVAMLRARHHGAVQRAVERLAFATPLIGSLKANVEVAHFAKTLSIMLRNGVSLVNSLEATAGALKSHASRDLVARAIAELRNGERLADSIDAAGHFPMLAKRLIRIGEETGTLPDMLAHVAKTLEEESTRQVALIFQLVPPVLTLLIGLGVGSFILVIMDAVLSVNDLAF